MILASVIGVVVWLFILSDPSPTAWILADLLLVYAVCGYGFLMLSIEDIFPDGAIPVNAEQIPKPQIRHDSASAAKDASGRIIEEINTATKAWGLDKKGR